MTINPITITQVRQQMTFVMPNVHLTLGFPQYIH